MDIDEKVQYWIDLADYDLETAEVLEKVRKYSILLKSKLPYKHLYLFGSWANGTQNEHSDIDVAVVIDYTPDDFFSITPMLWKLRRQVDYRIEPLLIDSHNDPSGFLQEIINHGIEIH